MLLNFSKPQAPSVWRIRSPHSSILPPRRARPLPARSAQAGARARARAAYLQGAAPGGWAGVATSRPCGEPESVPVRGTRRLGRARIRNRHFLAMRANRKRFSGAREPLAPLHLLRPGCSTSADPIGPTRMRGRTAAGRQAERGAGHGRAMASMIVRITRGAVTRYGHKALSRGALTRCGLESIPALGRCAVP